MSTVSPVAEQQAPPDLQPIYKSMKDKFGKMPNFFGVMAHRPAVLKNFLPLYGAITAEGTLEQRFKELAYLKTSITNGCKYCTQAHSASGKKAGLTDEQIQALSFYGRSKLFNEKEKAILRFSDQINRAAATVSGDNLREIRQHLSEEQIVELTLVVAIANFTNRVNDALLAEPDLG